MKKEIIPIFFAVDDNYATLLHVGIESIISQASKAYDYHIHILCDNLNEVYKKSFLACAKDGFKIIITEMGAQIAKYAEKMHLRDYYTKTIYFRVFIAEMFPEYHKALYLDSDAVLNSDISEFFNFDLGDNYVGAITCETVDTTPVFTEYAQNFLGLTLPYYFNSGIMVLNLDMMRKVNFQEQFFDIANKVKFYVAPDQDYFNVLCQGKVKFIPEARNYIWNKTPCPQNPVDLEKVKLVHYNLAYRPWRYDGVMYEDLFWKHAKNTPVYEKLLEMKRRFSQKDAEYDRTWMQNLVKLAEGLAKTEESVNQKIRSGKIVLMG